MKQRFKCFLRVYGPRSFASHYPAEKRVRAKARSPYYFSVCTGLPTLTPCYALSSCALVPLPKPSQTVLWSQYSPSFQSAWRALPCSVPHSSAPLATPSARLGCTALGTFFLLALVAVARSVSLCCHPLRHAHRLLSHAPCSCLHISLLVVSLGFSVPFANAALFWRFVVRSGDCSCAVGTRHGCLSCPPVAPGGGFTLTHFRTAAHAARPPPAPP